MDYNNKITTNKKRIPIGEMLIQKDPKTGILKQTRFDPSKDSDFYLIEEAKKYGIEINFND